MSDLKRRISFAATPERDVITKTLLLSNSPPSYSYGNNDNDATTTTRVLGGTTTPTTTSTSTGGTVYEGVSSSTLAAAAATTVVSSSQRQRHQRRSTTSSSTTTNNTTNINAVTSSSSDRIHRRSTSGRRSGPRLEDMELNQHQWTADGADSDAAPSLTRRSSTASSLAATAGGVYLSASQKEGGDEEVATSASFYPTSLHRRKRQLQQQQQQEHRVQEGDGGMSSPSSRRRSASREEDQHRRSSSNEGRRRVSSMAPPPPPIPANMRSHPSSSSSTTTTNPKRVHSSDVVGKLRRSSSTSPPTNTTVPAAVQKRAPSAIPTSSSMQPTTSRNFTTSHNNIPPSRSADETELTSPSPPRRVPVTITSSHNNSRRSDESGGVLQPPSTTTWVSTSNPPPSSPQVDATTNSSLQYYLGRTPGTTATAATNPHNDSNASTIELNVSAASTAAQPPHTNIAPTPSPSQPLPHRVVYSQQYPRASPNRGVPTTASLSSCHHHSCRVGHCMLNQEVIAERIALEAAVTRLQSELEYQRQDLAIQQQLPATPFHRSSPPPSSQAPSPMNIKNHDEVDRKKIRLQEDVITHLEGRLQEMERQQQQKHDYGDGVHHHHDQHQYHHTYSDGQYGSRSGPTPASGQQSPVSHPLHTNTTRSHVSPHDVGGGSGLSRAEQWRHEMDAKFRRLYQRREEELSSSATTRQHVATQLGGDSEQRGQDKDFPLQQGAYMIRAGSNITRNGGGGGDTSAHTSGLNISAVSTGGASSTMSYRHTTAPRDSGTATTATTSQPFRHPYHHTVAPHVATTNTMNRAVALPPPNLDEAFRSIRTACDTIHHAATQVLTDIRQLEAIYSTTASSTPTTQPSCDARRPTTHTASPVSSSPPHHHHHLHSSPSMPGIISLHDDSPTSSSTDGENENYKNTRRRRRTDGNDDLMSPIPVERRTGNTRRTGWGTSAEVDI